MIARLIVVQVFSVIVAALILWLALTLARGQGLEHPVYGYQPQPHSHESEVGKFYETWQRPDARLADGKRHISCCNKMDCEAPEIISRGGKLFARNHKRRPGLDTELPEQLMEHNQEKDGRESPDGKTHVCANHTGVICVVLGSGT